MANILTSANFIDDCQISLSTISEIETAFTTFLAKMEAEFLRKVLGVKLYASFKTAWASNPTSGIWFDLINGASYNDDECYFEGLKTALTYYTYVQYQYNKESIAVVNGNIKSKQDNATTINVIGKVINANNRCLIICRKIEDFCSYNEEYSDLIYTPPFNSFWNAFGI